MTNSRFLPPFCKVCALAGTILILPVLAYAGHDQGKKGDNDDNKGKGSDRGDKQIPVVPEANAAWVLVPFLGAVLLFSSRRFFSANLAKN
jgi:hypothetical protein